MGWADQPAKTRPKKKRNKYLKKNYQPIRPPIGLGVGWVKLSNLSSPTCFVTPMHRYLRDGFLVDTHKYIFLKYIFVKNMFFSHNIVWIQGVDREEQGHLCLTLFPLPPCQTLYHASSTFHDNQLSSTTTSSYSHLDRFNPKHLNFLINYQLLGEDLINTLVYVAIDDKSLILIKPKTHCSILKKF